MCQVSKNGQVLATYGEGSSTFSNVEKMGYNEGGCSFYINFEEHYDALWLEYQVKGLFGVIFFIRIFLFFSPKIKKIFKRIQIRSRVQVTNVIVVRRITSKVVIIIRLVSAAGITRLNFVHT